MTRRIDDMAIQQSTDGLRELALFAGAGGGILGGKLLGWRTVCAVERDAYAAQVLAQRQNYGILEPFPIWSQIESFDGKPWRGIVDVISGGFPCQDISAAGKGAGITGERSGLWKEFARIIGEVEPRFVFVENSPMLTIRGLGVLLGDLASIGFDAEWGVLSAEDVGAPHLRERLWVLGYSSRAVIDSNGEYTAPVAYSESESSEWAAGRSEVLANTAIERRQQVEQSEFSSEKSKETTNTTEYCCVAGRREWWPTEPDVGRVANGVDFRVDRLKALGNGQVPRVAATAWRLLSERAGI